MRVGRFLSVALTFTFFVCAQGVGNAGTIEDDFDAQDSSAWHEVLGTWVFQEISDPNYGYHGYGSGAADEPAASVVDNAQPYYNANLLVEARLNVTERYLEEDLDGEHWNSAGFSFSLNHFGTVDFNGYTVDVDINNDSLSIGKVNEEGPNEWVSTTGLGLEFDVWYTLRLSVNPDENMNAYLYEADGTTLVGQVIDIEPFPLPYNYGLVAIFADGDALFDDFSLTGTPVPAPAALLLFGSGLIGLLGFRRKLR
ncbi:MAG: PEP-CTERM sorting domain-containing protein [Deltaproteobacteria bacterium]|nr:PEP-CTERM sorting domain-containing protein [Deltaproteobacteria bacterium]